MGMLIWEGPSTWDGEPIALLASGYDSRSQNNKTGRMVQTWIVRQDSNPSQSKRDGKDGSVCGDCEHRPDKSDTCYVLTWRGADPCHNQYKAGRSAPFNLDLLAGKPLRLGAWGDPAMVPLDVWMPLLEVASSRTGYTHQWRRHPEWKPYVMASCDSPEDVVEAESLGWRAYGAWRGERPKGLVPCPASEEQGHRLQCDACLMCDGANTSSKQSRSVFIQLHGPKKNKSKQQPVSVPA